MHYLHYNKILHGIFMQHNPTVPIPHPLYPTKLGLVSMKMSTNIQSLSGDNI